MSHKIAFILSLIFLSMFFLLGGDLITLQYTYSDLDAKGINISYLVSKSGRVDDDYRKELEKRYDVNLTFQNTTTPKFGDVVDYIISKEIDPIIMSKETMMVTLKRSAIIGYYG